MTNRILMSNETDTTTSTPAPPLTGPGQPLISTDPAVHRAREQQLVQHVQRLLTDPRLRVDTANGVKPITTMQADVRPFDRALDVKNEMIRLNLPDRDLQNRMPIGEGLEVTLYTRRMLFFRKVVGRVRVVTVAPTKALLKGDDPKPLTTQDINRLMSEMPPSLGGVPTTVVLLSTAGYTLEAHESAQRRPDRTLILVEPNGAGGWSTHGPVEMKALVDLFDPEGDEQKRQRIRELIEQAQTDLMMSGISTERLATKAQLPLQVVEAELKSYAKEHPGLAAKRIDGRVVLFREGSGPLASASGLSLKGATDMPLVDRLKSLFARKGETEKKIAFLSEQRTRFAQQLDRAYDEIGALEQRDTKLREEFKNATGEITKRRITSQLVQLRKDMDRRQQLVGVLTSRVNVVSTHLHNLELVRQDETAKMPDAEEIAADAAAAEETLAELQASAEVADSVSGVASLGMSEEEQELFEQLEREAGRGKTEVAEAPAPEASSPARETGGTQRAPSQPASPPRATPSTPESNKRRTEPEAG
jgi:hypothetical protein